MGGSRIKGRILQAAIHLFGKLGFEGVTTRAIAREAHCMEGGIYRLYGDKGRLYEEAVTTVVQATVDGMAAVALGFYRDDGEASQEDTVRTTVHRWYSSLSLDGAKLVQQVLLNDKAHKEKADQSFANVVAILQRILDADSESAAKFDFKTRAEGLVSTLFQLKLSYGGPADREKQELDRYLQDWLLTLPRKDKARYPFRGGAEIPRRPRSSQRS
jgi:AcrR family transcriptional regulator